MYIHKKVHGNGTSARQARHPRPPFFPTHGDLLHVRHHEDDGQPTRYEHLHAPRNSELTSLQLLMEKKNQSLTILLENEHLYLHLLESFVATCVRSYRGICVNNYEF